MFQKNMRLLVTCARAVAATKSSRRSARSRGDFPSAIVYQRFAPLLATGNCFADHITSSPMAGSNGHLNGQTHKLRRGGALRNSGGRPITLRVYPILVSGHGFGNRCANSWADELMRPVELRPKTLCRFGWFYFRGFPNGQAIFSHQSLELVGNWRHSRADDGLTQSFSACYRAIEFK